MLHSMYDDVTHSMYDDVTHSMYDDVTLTHTLPHVHAPCHLTAHHELKCRVFREQGGAGRAG